MPTETKEPDFETYFEQLSRLGNDDTPPANFGQSETPAVADTSATETPAGKAPATGDDGTSAAQEPAAPAVASDETPADGGGDATAAAADGTSTGGASDQGVAPAAAAEQSQGQDTALLARLADLLQQRQPAPQAQPQVQPQPVKPAPLYTEAEVARITQFQKDWPDIFEAFSLLARGNVAQQNAYIFNEIGRVLGPQAQRLDTLQVDHQYTALKTAIPDYDEVRDTVIQWARTDPGIPGYLRTAYNGVIDNGDVGEITDLVNRWRSATGKAAPTVQPRTAAPAAKVNDLSPAAIQAAAALAPVVSKRTTSVPSELTSFDDAFAAFAKA